MSMTVAEILDDAPPKRIRKVHIAPEVKLALSVEEAAGMMSTSDRTIRDLIDKGVLKKVPHTNRVLVARKELERWADLGVTATASQ